MGLYEIYRRVIHSTDDEDIYYNESVGIVMDREENVSNAVDRLNAHNGSGWCVGYMNAELCFYNNCQLYAYRRVVPTTVYDILITESF